MTTPVSDFKEPTISNIVVTGTNNEQMVFAFDEDHQQGDLEAEAIARFRRRFGYDPVSTTTDYVFALAA